ncbi:DgyrCDS3932 [Dimorphilus gyrociliatus]|uniref:DgyrCDS3932 n=1 Tax=Dimorphilus gyrociliatus TaxID=2664684 RepID=A0A7I8VFE2_9ANNE|nr:DgyrCDS3932 [Dimorphilus gyrociliatus]
MNTNIGNFQCENIAVNIGCGSGQSICHMSQYFQKIIAIDESVDNIKRAKCINKNENVEFAIGSFDQIPAEDNSVSLVYCGTAVHCFQPIEKFYIEAKRVLVPGGYIIIPTSSPSVLEESLTENIINRSLVILKIILSYITKEWNFCKISQQDKKNISVLNSINHLRKAFSMEKCSDFLKRPDRTEHSENEDHEYKWPIAIGRKLLRAQR